jgi:mRNA interferase MazF
MPPLPHHAVRLVNRIARSPGVTLGLTAQGHGAGMAHDDMGEPLHLSACCHSRPAGKPLASITRTTIKAAPHICNVYWCSFPECALPPEFSKRRPVIVVSHRNSLTGPIWVVPMTTKAQPANRWALKLARNPVPKKTCDAWAVCNHLYTVSCTRLMPTHGAVPRLTVAEFKPVYELVLRWLPKVLDVK